MSETPALRCYHEAAHAVLAAHVGFKVRYVSIKDVEEKESAFLPRRDICVLESGDKLRGVKERIGTALATMAPRYAERIHLGEPLDEHISLEDLKECVASGDCEDCKLIWEMLGDEPDTEHKLYEGLCEQAALLAEGFFPQIEAVAERLSEAGYLEGSEVRRIIKSVRAS